MSPKLVGLPGHLESRIRLLTHLRIKCWNFDQRCLLRPLTVQDGVDADAACQVGCEQAVRIEPPLDGQEVFVAGKHAVKLPGPQDLVLGEVNLAAAPDRGIDEAVDGRAAGGLVAGLGVELEVEAVAVLGERDQAVVRPVRAQDGRDRRTG